MKLREQKNIINFSCKTDACCESCSNWVVSFLLRITAWAFKWGMDPIMAWHAVATYCKNKHLYHWIPYVFYLEKLVITPANMIFFYLTLTQHPQDNICELFRGPEYPWRWSPPCGLARVSHLGVSGQHPSELHQSRPATGNGGTWIGVKGIQNHNIY